MNTEIKSITDRLKKLAEKNTRTDEEVKAFENQRDSCTNKKTESEKLETDVNKTLKNLMSQKPTDLCRTNIFHVLHRHGRKALQKKQISKEFTTSWGHVTYTGPILSVDDEDVLLSISMIALKKNNCEFITTYKDIQLNMGIKRPHPNNNQRIKESMLRLSQANFIMESSQEDCWAVTGIMKSLGKRKQLGILMDKTFYEMIKNKYTVISIPFRLSLKGDLTKLLYSFLRSHRSPKQFKTATLCSVLNLGWENIESNPNEKRRVIYKLKKAFTELKKNGFLSDYTYNKSSKVFSISILKKKKI